MEIRLATDGDADAMWAILEPIIRAGETYALPRDMTRDAALAWWTAPSHETYVAIDGAIVGGNRILRTEQTGFNGAIVGGERLTRVPQTGFNGAIVGGERV